MKESNLSVVSGVPCIPCMVAGWMLRKGELESQKICSHAIFGWLSLSRLLCAQPRSTRLGLASVKNICVLTTAHLRGTAAQRLRAEITALRFNTKSNLFLCCTIRRGFVWDTILEGGKRPAGIDATASLDVCAVVHLEDEVGCIRASARQFGCASRVQNAPPRPSMISEFDSSVHSAKCRVSKVQKSKHFYVLRLHRIQPGVLEIEDFG